MTQYNIEFAHIYADQKFSSEQEESINRLKEKISQKKGKSYVTTVLIDELNAKNKDLDIEDYLDIIRQKGGQVDYLVLESDLISLANKLLEEISPDVVVERNFKGKKVCMLVEDDVQIGLRDIPGNPSCSLLIAAWILCRLGYYELGKLQSYADQDFAAQKLITILPKKYEATEKKVWKILEHTRYRDCLSKLEYDFY